MPPKINDLLVKSTDPRVYVITMHENTKHTITSHTQTEFRKYATSDPNVLTAKADGQQGKVWLNAKDAGKADLSFEARNITIQVGIPPMGKPGKPSSLGIYADNAWTAVKIEATVIAKPTTKPKPKEEEEEEEPARPPKPPKPPKPKASPAARKVVLAENYLDNDRPEKALELLEEAEQLEGADEEKKRIAALRKRANKSIKDNG